MKHVIICREYPPAPSGGIGTYVFHISRLLAEAGETVHVIGQLWSGAEKTLEEKCDGKLIIHRLPFEDWVAPGYWNPSPLLKTRELKALFESGYHPQCFSWQASLLTEKLVEEEGIDVIEAQEYEAPLYYFQLRRALGLGPKRQPPCIVHAHSPTELIARYDDWDLFLPRVVTAKRLEDYSIGAADVVLCPSHYLARQVEARYGLGEGAVLVIPYPMGDTKLLERSKDTWERGTICYVGRLERRKGVLEWIDAAVSVASDYPEAQFAFVGANVLDTAEMNGEEMVSRRIPGDLKEKFKFHGKQERWAISKLLIGARIAVVPSRWENFPNTCIEAMCSGLPVLASREGGMAEMIEDGRSGWLARDPSPKGLAEALRRALQTPVATVIEMGRNAWANIHRICDNGKIIESQLDFRRKLVRDGARRSVSLPRNLSGAGQCVSGKSAQESTKAGSPRGLAVVVVCRNDGKSLGACLNSIGKQKNSIACAVVVDAASSEDETLEALVKAEAEGWRVLRQTKDCMASGKNAGIQSLRATGVRPLGYIFLQAENLLNPGFGSAAESILERVPEAGIVSCWTEDIDRDGKIWIKPCPGFPYQWLSNDVASFSAVRTEALHDIAGFDPEMGDGYEDWDLFNRVMAAGWQAVTVPQILGQKPTKDLFFLPYRQADRMMREKLIRRHPQLIEHYAMDLILAIESNAVRATRVETPAQVQQAPNGRWRTVKRILRQHMPVPVYNLIRHIKAYASRGW